MKLTITLDTGVKTDKNRTKKHFKSYQEFKKFIQLAIEGDQFNWSLEINFSEELSQAAMLVRTERWLSSQRLKNRPNMKFLILPKIVNNRVAGMIVLLGGCPAPNHNQNRLTSCRIGQDSYIYNLKLTGVEIANSLCYAHYEFLEQNHRHCTRGVPLYMQNYAKPLLTLWPTFGRIKVLEEAH